MNHNKTGVYLTVNKLKLLLCYKYSYLPCLDYYCTVIGIVDLIDVTE
jgi:hypothetical protein